MNRSYSFIKISLSTKNDLKNAIEKDTTMVETMCKTVEFISTKLEA